MSRPPAARLRGEGRTQPPPHRVTALPSGLRVVTLDMPAMESVSLGIWIGTGGRYESPRLNGVSHFLEHLLFKGTDRRSARRLSQEIESVGGSLNGFTGEEYTCYMAKVLHRHLRRAANVLFDMYLHASLKAEDVEKERTVIREEINMYLDMPAQHVTDLFNAVLWPGQPLGRPLVGTAETVGAFTPDDLRAYRARHYLPKNTVVAAAGKVAHEELVRIVERLAPGGPGRPAPRSAPAADRQRRPALLLCDKKTEQTHLCVGVRGYRREHPDRYALHLLSIALGENMSSRLFQSVRERHGLAYAIGSSVVRYRDTGAFSVHAGVENNKFLRALRLILRELASVRDEGLRPAELARAKEYWTGQFAMEFEKTTRNMLGIGEGLLLTGRVLTKEEILSNIARVGLDDVRRVAADIFRERRLNLAAIGPAVGGTAAHDALHL